MQVDRIFRIGDKMISLSKVQNSINKILELRQSGLSQHETARKLDLDRSFVSRLESLGEIRKGNRIAVIGFPLKNYEELTSVCQTKGLDFHLIMNNEQRWKMVSNKEALDFFNQMLDLISTLKNYDSLILLTSARWLQLAEALLDIQVVHVNLGVTPISEDIYFAKKEFVSILDQVFSMHSGR